MGERLSASDYKDTALHDNLEQEDLEVRQRSGGIAIRSVLETN